MTAWCSIPTASRRPKTGRRAIWPGAAARVCPALGRSAEAIKQAVIADVRRFISGADLVYDDITLVVAKQT